MILTVIFMERKKPGEALLWVLLIWLSPVIGSILYLMFGYTIGIKLTNRLRSGKISLQYKAKIKQQIDEHVPNKKALLEDVDDEVANENALFNLTCSESLLTEWNDVDIITDGQSKYAKLLTDIEMAKESIHMAYYGFHNDEIGRQFADALARKAKQGVTVRVLLDGVGSMFTPRRMFQGMLEHGGRLRKVKPYFTHFRYHRKIVVIDGRIGYTGGMNIGEKYIGRMKSKSPWRDTQIRMQGDAVYSLQYHFLYDWLYANTMKNPGISPNEFDALFPEHGVKNRLYCQILASGVDTERQNVKLSYIRMLSSAREKALFQTPYFIPDDSLLDALKVALGSGIEVAVMIPQRKSSFFLQPVTNYYIGRLIPLGLKVFLYDGYIHAKMLRVDDSVTCIGSVNIDIRSLEIDEEICAVLYGKEFAYKADLVTAVDYTHCTELDYEAFMKRNVFRRISEKFFHLFAPLM